MSRVFIGFASNFIGLLAAKYLVPEVMITSDVAGFAAVVAFLTIANSVILPVLRFIFKPLSFLTLGLFAFLLNAFMIYAVDFFSENITISGLLPLVLATVVIGAINATFAYGAKIFQHHHD